MPTSYRIAVGEGRHWQPETYRTRPDALRALVAQLRQRMKRGYRADLPDGYVAKQRDQRRPVADQKCSILARGRIDAPGKPYVSCGKTTGRCVQRCQLSRTNL